ncbi:MAG: hypothetical protein RLZ33_387 [Bacteroidota bacterium]|jgi:hypothetical protein
MMKNLFYTCSVLFFHFQTFSQNQIVSNQIEIGTTSFETYSNSISLSDGGMLLFCSTTSGISGNKTSPNFGGSDIWIVKMDASNGIQWQKSFGGTGYDDISEVIETSEGDLLIAATTSSTISGNQTSGNHGDSDYWILKLDANGNEIWQKSYGGTGSEQSVSLTQISPVRYVCSGVSDSPISGNKTENCRGTYDTWTILLDENGTILWDKTYGGNSIDGITDIAYFENSSEILLLGYSDSPISGDKTEGNYGLDDAWILKLDTNGSLTSQKTIGGDNSDGLSSITKIDLSNFYLVGGSYSGISGNKTSTNYGSSDAWVIKMNLNLDIIEDENYGGLASDGFEALVITSDNQKLFFGSSRSSNSFDLIETSNGLSDCWILSIASDGTINWSELIGGNSNESISIIKEISDNNYRIIAVSESGISGDKTVTNLGGADFWSFDLSTDLGITEKGLSMIDTYPNPFTSNLTMNFQSLKENVELVISSTDGKIISKQTIPAGTSSFNIILDCEPQLLYYSLSGNSGCMSGKLLKM